MNGLVYSYDLHWLVDLNQIKMICISEFMEVYSVVSTMKTGDRHILYKGTKEECERRLNDFAISLKVGLAPKILRF